MTSTTDRRRLLLAALAALAAGAFVLVYTGPGRVPLRHTGGDVAAGALVYALVGLARPRAATLARAALAFVIAAAVECAQLLALVGPDAPRWLHLTLGSTFDPADLVAYALGIGLAALATGRRGAG
ncbi:MAG: DUF2809 domain-containing protein [Myxococcales bacterium]|nr:DUF2809 domain-containing protein [Myxococcales bacterium]